MDDGTDWSGTYTSPGNVSAPDLTCYFHQNDCSGGPEVPQGIAHAYGESGVTSNFDCGPYNEIADIQNSKNKYPYYCRRTPRQQEFAYRFSEYNVKDAQGTYPFFTNRTITASAGQCFEYPQVNVPLDQDGTWGYEYSNGTFNGSISIPKKTDGFNGTTYIYRGSEIPQDEGELSCGPRCMWMWAHRNPGSGENSTFYQCPIVVSSVSNIINDNTQTVSDGMARLAASAIGLQGRYTSIGTPTWTQYQFFPFG